MTDKDPIEYHSNVVVRKVLNLFEKHELSDASNKSRKQFLRKRCSLESYGKNTDKETHYLKHNEDRLEHKYKKNEDKKTSHSTGSRVLSMIKRFECNIDESQVEKCDTDPEQSTRNDVRYNTSTKKKERKIIRSFVEAEDEGDTEEYRKNLLKQMDDEMAQMKKDGFIDDNENCDNYNTMGMCCGVSNNQLEGREYNSLDNKLSQHLSQRISHHQFPTQREEFSESLGDDLENGSSVVEAYNDDGRELIIVQMMVDRKPVYSNNLAEAITNSDFVLYENIDNTLKDISSDKLGFKISEHLLSDCHSFYPSTSSDGDVIMVGSDGSTPISGDRSTTYSDISVENPMYQYSPRLSENRWTNYSDTSFENSPISENMQPISENRWTIYSNRSSDSDHVYESIQKPLSNRSTICSTTSRESEDDEDDEGIGLQNVELRNSSYSNTRRETYCDDKGTVRIERIASLQEEVADQEDNVPLSPSSSSMTPLSKLGYIVNEIKMTERKYVQDLAKIVEVYYVYIRANTPPSLADTRKFLFGNIVELYRRQKEFLEDLERRDDVDSIVRTFISHETLFKRYPYYFRNKPKADRVLRDFIPIVKKMQEELNERLDFSAYLLTPLQRLGKYILFLENILSTLVKLNMPMGSTQMALDIIKREMSKGNDFVAIESIQNSTISKLDYGSFKIREMFNISKPKRVEAMVFLFTNVIVITTPDPKEKELFNYYDHIKMTDLRLVTFEDPTLHLTNFTKSKKNRNSSRFTYILEAKDEKTKALWKDTIETLLWQQFTLVKEKTLNVHKKKPNTEKKSTRTRIKSTGSSIFYVNEPI